MDIIVRVGFYSRDRDETRPIRFDGERILRATNKSEGPDHPNSYRWHDWYLYRVANGYRVLDEYHTSHKTESSHSGLSRVMKTPAEVAEHYPVLSNEAMRKGVWSLSEATAEARAGAENGKSQGNNFEYE
jgi:hypothetical protein